MSLAATTPNQQFGKYRLLKKLAQGGMAEIFLAIQHGPSSFEKVVVIKRMLPELCVSSDFVQMFLDEARVAARLDHPNIIRIYDFGDFEGQYYLAMEYVPGEDLASIVQQCKRTRTKIQVELVVDLMISAAEGLHHAHEMQDGEGNSLDIVHRDVSPSNIICGYQGAVKILDFGVARAKNNISRTSPGVRKGTPQYLAPEQALGEGVDRRADIFALGLVMHELLTGNRLFQRENEHATISAIIGDDIVPPSLWRPELPAEIDRVVMKAMSRNPVGRYPSALEMAADMSAFLAGTDYDRGSRQLEFLTSVFGEERKREKQRLALGVSPEDLASGPNLAPLRDTGSSPLPAERPATGPGRPKDRPTTGGSGLKRAAAAVPPRRSNPQLAAPSIAPLVPLPSAPVVPLPSPSLATPIAPVPAPVSKEVPSFHKLMDNGAARPLTPPGAKTARASGSRPAPAPSRPASPLTAADLFADLEGTPASPAPAHAPARTPAPARSEPLRAEPARPEAPRSPPFAASHSGVSRRQALRLEPSRFEVSRPEAIRSRVSPSGASQLDLSQFDLSQFDLSRLDLSRSSHPPRRRIPSAPRRRRFPRSVGARRSRSWRRQPWAWG
jgi:serine/threonine protein kinase